MEIKTKSSERSSETRHKNWIPPHRFTNKSQYLILDCAPVYQNEREVGDAIRESIESGIVKRKDLFVTSKLWNTFHRPELIRTGAEQTLHDLQLDYLDSYIIHWPVVISNSHKILRTRLSALQNPTTFTPKNPTAKPTLKMFLSGKLGKPCKYEFP
jgi:hypothetical protein